MLNRSERNTAKTSLFIGVLPSDRYCQDERRSSPREHSRWGEKGMILKEYDAAEKALGGPWAGSRADVPRRVGAISAAHGGDGLPGIQSDSIDDGAGECGAADALCRGGARAALDAGKRSAGARGTGCAFASPSDGAFGRR